MFDRREAFPQPGLGKEGVDGVGVGEEDCLGEDPDLDQSRV